MISAMNASSVSTSMTADGLDATVTAEINVFTMLLALGFPAEVAAVAARPDTFAG